MATNRDLLKEAIADAKAVKDTAIANAKAALEEAFTPFLKEKLASKIAEMDEVEELELEESEVSEVEKEMEAMKKSDDTVEEISLDELLAELELEENGDESDMKDENYMEEDLYEAEGEEEMSIEDMSEDDLKSFIEDVIKDMVAAGELEAGETTGEEGMEGEEGEEGTEGEEGMDMDMMGGEEEVDEDINIDELLAELEEAGAYKKKAKAKAKGSLASTKGKDEYVTDETEEDDVPVSASKAKKLSFEEGQVDEAISPDVWGLVASMVGVPLLALGGAKAQNALQNLANKGNETAKKAMDFLTGMGKAAGSGKLEETDDVSEELDEAYSTIEELRNELNEINLLNAKLLYTNKIFRNKSLTETQKVHVLTSFDKATTKKEVELVYNTLTESLKASATKAPIKESLGSASKALGGATSKPIIENDAFARMRELAFGGNK